jgi:hypothetical protein
MTSSLNRASLRMQAAMVTVNADWASLGSFYWTDAEDMIRLMLNNTLLVFRVAELVSTTMHV